MLSYSCILEIKFWRSAKIARLPRSLILISSETSSPTSKSGSIFLATDSAISWLSLVTAPSSTTMRFLNICRSPLSGLIMMSKLSSEPYFFFRVLRKTSSKIAIRVSRLISLSSLNSEKDSINSRLFIYVQLKFNDYFSFFYI